MFYFLLITGHPRFFNQLSTGLDMIALSGEWLTATANTNMYVRPGACVRSYHLPPLPQYLPSARHLL